MPDEFVQNGHINFSGGLNTRVDESVLPPNYFSKFRNVTLYNRTLQKRLGSTRQVKIDKTNTIKLNGTDQYIEIPHHIDYNSFHLNSSDDGVSFYLDIQLSFSYSNTPLPIIYKKNSFLLYIDNDKKVKLYWKDRSVDTLLTSPYDLSDLHPMTSSAGSVNLGLQFSNFTTQGITLWANGMLISDQAENGPGSLNTHLWDDFDDTSASKIYLGYYDGIDFSGSGLSSIWTYTGNMWEFRIWRSDTVGTAELALSDNNKKKYAFGTLPSSESSNAFLKGHWKLDEIGGVNVLDSDSNANTGTLYGSNRVSENFGNINARGVIQFRRQTSSDIKLLDGGQSIFQDVGTNEYIRLFRRDPDRISADESITITYAGLTEVETYNDRMYFVSGEEKPLKHNGTYISEMGIDSPSNAPTLNTASAGALTGAYKWVYTFYNSSEAIESSVSPIYSATLSSNQVLLNLDRPRDRQVDQIRIYRTKAGGAIYFLVETIDAWTSYTFNSALIIWSDNFQDSTLSSTVSPSLNAVPPQSKYIAEHHDRFFLAGNPTNPTRLYYSESALVEYFPAANTIDIGLTSEGDITGLNYSRGRIYIFKEKAIWYLYGTTPSTFYTDYITRDVGCTVPRSRILVDDIMFFCSSDGIYSIQGTSGVIKNISEQIKPTYLALNHSQKEQWFAVHNRKFNQYILFCSSTSSSVNDIALVYDYTTGGWSVWDIYADAAGAFFESSKDEVYTINDANSSASLILFKQNNGFSDGVSLNLPLGQPTLFGSNWIEDSYRLYPFVDDELVGCPIFLVDYENESIQKRMITDNTAGRITVDTNFSPSLDASYYYFIGGIRFQFETGWLDAGAVQRKKRYQSIDILFNPSSILTTTNGSRTIILQPIEQIRMGSAIDYETSFSSSKIFSISDADGHVRWSVSRRGRYIKLQIISIAPNTPVDINKIIYGIEYKDIR